MRFVAGKISLNYHTEGMIDQLDVGGLLGPAVR
jgi:hypothetical protein